MELDFNIQSQINEDISTISHLISLNPLDTISDIYVQKAIITEIMICLSDLMQKCKKLNVTVDFTDDIDNISILKDKNITGLVAYIRDCLCHIDSQKHVMTPNITMSYCIVKGPCTIIQIPNLELISKYDDDICIIFGPQKIYYKRHIIRAFNECKKNLSQFMHIEE